MKMSNGEAVGQLDPAVALAKVGSGKLRHDEGGRRRTKRLKSACEVGRRLDEAGV